ncbi:MAG: pilus assembly protein [Thermoanaerobaculia bacterium]
MTRLRIRRAAFAAFAALGVLHARALLGDDKDLLKRGSVPPNVLIVFGNSQSTNQPIQGSSSAWDGDADSPSSKLGAAKRVLRQFVADKRGNFNVGLTSFAHNPNAGSISIYGKHWLYSPLSDDFPSESWKEPAGTIERWGPGGEGPCRSLQSPSCAGASSFFVTLAANATVVGPFFGPRGSVAPFVYLNGSASSASRRIRSTLTRGAYGDAFTDGTLSAYPLPGPPPHSMEVTKEYQEKVSGIWQTMTRTPSGDPGTVTVAYTPPAVLDADSFFTSAPSAGSEIGFLNDPRGDFAVGSNCSGWEFQVNSAPLPLVKVPRDYKWGASCLPPQDSYPCVSRMMRPQGVLSSYDPATGAFSTADHDNPGYAGSGSRFADGCDSALLGAVDAGLNVTENQAILTTRNGSQAPIKDLLKNVYDYFNTSSIDGFQNGKRLDDPDASCRHSVVILIYDNFNGCQNDNCSFLTNFVLTPLKRIGVPVFVIGFGAGAVAGSSTGVCIAQNSGAVLSDGSIGYFPVSSSEGLRQALSDIFSIVNEGSKDFASATVSSVQAGADQMVYLATFNAAKNRSIWNGRVNGYRLDPQGSVQLGVKTIADPNDPNRGLTLPAPSNSPASLIWNAGQNLAQTPGTGASNPAAVLFPGAPLLTGSYADSSNDTVTMIATRFYPGRKIVFSLPASMPAPLTTLPLTSAGGVPEARWDMTYSPAAPWWPAVKALLGPQTAPPGVLSPALTDTDAGNTLRFIWGDRDAVMTTTEASQRYQGLKLGDVFHSTPVVVGQPGDYPYYVANLHSYQKFYRTYRQRRRVLFLGANDGLLHAFDAGAFARDPSMCRALSDGRTPPCYDLGTGAELFAYAPRSVFQNFKRLKDAAGPQTKADEWTVDGGPAGADVFTDANHPGTPDPARRAWRTVIVGGMREGSAFEGTAGAAPRHSSGSYYALDVTQPDELVTDGSGAVVPPATPPGYTAPKCLNASGDASCGRDASDPAVRGVQPARAWPTVLWEISDAGDADAPGSPGAGYPDMGETWSKPAVGRVKICVSDCGSTSSPAPGFEDHYVAIFGGGFDRERSNRRGNWLYMVDIETGRSLYRANSSCGVNSGTGGCVPTYFGSIPSEPAALDLNGDGYMDFVYVGDTRGQLWRLDLTDLRQSAAPTGGSFGNQLDLAAGSGKPFLLFQAPQPGSAATVPFFPIYFRPTAVSLGYTSGNRAIIGIAFGTGDRDDILATTDTSSLTYSQRFYYVLDDSNSRTRTEADLVRIASSTSPKSIVPAPRGWFLNLAPGERVITDSLAIKGVISFSTFNPGVGGASNAACGNPLRCGGAGGTARFYSVLYSNGDPYVGTDRGETQTNSTFLTNPIFYTSEDQQGHIFYTSDNTVTIKPVPGGTRTTVKDWKER